MMVIEQVQGSGELFVVFTPHSERFGHTETWGLTVAVDEEAPLWVKEAVQQSLIPFLLKMGYIPKPKTGGS